MTDEPDLPQPSDVRAAAQRLSGHLRTTPVLTVTGADCPAPAASVSLKCEFLQHTGSFKVRGAFNRILSAADAAGPGHRQLQVVAASGGNAGLAVAHAAAQLGHRSVVFVPETAPAVKVARLHALGADVRQVGTEYAHALAAAEEYAGHVASVFVHAYDQPEVVAGQGTIALELLEQVPQGLDTLLVVVGGGGLIGGCAVAVGDSVQLVGVEPQGAPTLHAALAAGEPVDVPVGGVAADSLGARRLGRLAWQAVRRHGIESVVVPDEQVVRARRNLWERFRVVVEHGTAAAWAALLTGAYRPATDERVGVLLCGANTDPSTL
ncbi:MAG TPA: threonine/serine dehydratase [Segeticoccus sp.]|uniref:threonine/serine dehydratase n=1 Tax=Segeticoccus sp. TaxID=2706531 RepID=UPI002D7E4C5F|nr:threonine/serine dehydratase [Segeticoccus sp.]HET8601571.1 threonine/serine dehydratase [Segeticoccus sp.]